jgi:hypothetical protein
MMEKLRKRGEVIAKQQLLRTKSEIKSVLRDELPDDIRIIETGEGIQLEARRLQQRLIDNSNLRDIGFLMRAVR